MTNWLVKANALDEDDPLKHLRERFNIPLAKNTCDNSKIEDDRKCIYLNGNSLGCMPKTASEETKKVLDNWKVHGMHCHFSGFLPAALCDEWLIPPMAKIVGAQEDEICLMNGLSVNLHLLMNSFYRPNGKRRKILIESGAFPSDYYTVASQIEMRGLDPSECLVEVSNPDGPVLRNSDIISTIQSIGDELALVLFPGVQYYTGQVFDMQEITAIAHEVGAICGLDLAHAVGNVILRLHEWDVDFAVWCNYKYMNGSPGAMGGAFMHSRLKASDIIKPRGWWGHELETRFKMDNKWKGSGGIKEFRLCNPPPVLAAPLYASLQVFEETDIENLRAKGVQLSGFMIEMLKDTFEDKINIITPIEEESRGCQVSFGLMGADISKVFEELRVNGVVCDFREPNSIRTAAVPLYNTFLDVFTFVTLLKNIYDANTE